MNTRPLPLFLALLFSGHVAYAATLTWTGAAGDGSWHSAANWDSGSVPGAADDAVVTDSVNVTEAVTVAGLTLAPGKTLHASGPAALLSVTGKTVGDGASLRTSGGGGLQLPGAASWRNGSLNFSGDGLVQMPGLSDVDNSVFALRQGAKFALPATLTSYRCAVPDHVAIFDVQDAGSVLDLSGLRLLNVVGANLWRYVYAQKGGRVELPNLERIDCQAAAFEFHVDTGGALVLDRLLGISGGTGYGARFFVGVPELRLPELYDIQGKSDFTLGENARVVLPQLTGLGDCKLGLPAGSEFQAPALQSLTGSSVSLTASAKLTTGTLADVDGSSFALRQGAKFALPATLTSYRCAVPVNLAIFDVQDPGSELDASGLRVLNVSGGSYNRYVYAQGGGRVDLSNLERLDCQTGAFDVRLDTGGSLALDRLQEISGGTGLGVRFFVGIPELRLPELYDIQGRSDFTLEENARVVLPQLTGLSDCKLGLPAGSEFQAPALQSLTGSSVSLTASAKLTTGTLADVDGSSFALRQGAKYALPATLTSYHCAVPDHVAIFDVQDPGSALDASGLRALRLSGVSYWRYVYAQNGGRLDLSNLERIDCQSAAFDFHLDTGGSLALDQIQEISGGTGLGVRFYLGRENLALPALQTATLLSLHSADAGDILVPQLTNIVSATIQLNGSAANQAVLDAPLLARIQEGSVTLDRWGKVRAQRLVLAGVTLDAEGTFEGTLVNRGLITPRGDRFAITGDFVQEPAGRTVFDLRGRAFGAKDFLLVSGGAVLAGAVEAVLAADFVPTYDPVVTARNRYTLIQAAAVSGEFGVINGARIQPGLEFQPEYQATEFSLRVGPDVPPQVVAVVPEATVESGWNFAEVTFSEPIAPASLNPDSVTLRAPDGSGIGVGTPGQIGSRTWRIPFPAQTSRGTYALSFLPTITDAAGNALTAPVNRNIQLLGPLVEILANPPGQSFPLGQRIELTAGTRSPDVEKFQWRLNGVDIPGATHRNYLIEALSPASAGAYTVLIDDAGQTWQSEPVLIELQLPLLALVDRLAERQVFTEASFVGGTNNLAATGEAGEPKHAGKAGGKSMWLGWRAPETGVATFRTTGSSFDTLLAAYTGTGYGDLVEVASDEDGGGFLTSEVRFNAVAGVEYLIVVDGFAGASGNIVLGWELVATQERLPEITQQPAGKVAVTGEAVTLIAAATPANAALQWFANGEPLAGANQATLVLPAVTPAQAGTYRLRVTAPNGLVAESRDALVEVSATAGPVAFSADKLEDLFLDEVAARNGIGLAGRPRPHGFTSLSVGSLAFNTRGALTSPNDPLLCGGIGGASRWFRFRAAQTGPVTLATTNTAFDTLLAVFTNRFNLTPVACNDDALPGLRNSRLRFVAEAGVDYLVVVDGKRGDAGACTLTWQAGDAVPLLGEVLFLGLDGGHFRFEQEAANGAWELSTADVLGDWRPLLRTAVTDGVFRYTDPDPATRAARFFRLAAAQP